MDKERGPAIVVAVLLHAVLFLMIRPPIEPLRSIEQTPPKTFFGSAPAEDSSASGRDIRTVWSPVLFSLPSGMGFSRDLLTKDVQTRLSFSQEVKSEQFLQVDPAAHTGADQVIPRDVLVTSKRRLAPGVPAIADGVKKPVAPRVYIAPELKSRLLGGIVLPPELNQQVASPWEVRASLSISGEGMVRHVFLEQPLKSVSLNQQVLQLLYSLRFKSGPALEGSIELYSPEATAGGLSE